MLADKRPAISVVQKFKNFLFPGSQKYWEKRYSKNGNSGNGSYGEKANYKATIINQFVEKNKIQKVLELGCGDGNQLKQFSFPEYIGLDVSPTAVKLCKDIFREDATKEFCMYDDKAVEAEPDSFHAELILSLDVVYHLVEDEVYEKYMHRLFSLSTRYVIIYAWDVEEAKKFHVRHRNFSRWIKENISGFQLKERITQSPYCDFFIYEKIGKI
jgi:cyclopropane fatty-acyl-phospholipid synthase-like methyltransferase